MSHDNAGGPYRVGKGKPPLEHRWKKGQPSPNPKGRPKGPTPATELLKMLRKKVWVTGANGRRVQKSFDAVISHRLIELAVSGDFAAIKHVTTLAAKHRLAESLSIQAAAADQPSPAETAEREALSARLVGLLEEKAAAKRARIDFTGPIKDSDAC